MNIEKIGMYELPRVRPLLFYRLEIYSPLAFMELYSGSA
jgi:hypothetical protein